MNTGRVVLGTAFLVLGVLVILDQQAVLDAGRVVGDWWPLLVLLAAALDLVSRPPRIASATVLGLLGAGLLLVTTDVVDASVWELLWPVTLVGLGLWLVLRRPGGAHHDTDDESIDVVAMFSGRRIAMTTPRFRGGSATAVFGGVEVDLGSAQIDGEAVLDAVALFGGVSVEVPLGWRVVLDGPAVFGGHETHVPPPASPDAPVLRVRATAVFGGVDVKVSATAPAVADGGVPA